MNVAFAEDTSIDDTVVTEMLHSPCASQASAQ